MNYTKTDADYFTFNVDNSAFITGQTGSGKSYLVEQLIKRYANDKTSDDIQFAFFDFKQVEFGNWVNHPEEDKYKIADKLYCPVVTDPEEGLSKLEELAELSKKRADKDIKKPLIFIAIDECDAACVDQNRFDKAVITINHNAKDANMKLIFDTSRPAPDVISKELLQTFDLVLAGQLASKVDADYLGVPYIENIEQYSFVVV